MKFLAVCIKLSKAGNKQLLFNLAPHLRNELRSRYVAFTGWYERRKSSFCNKISHEFLIKCKSLVSSWLHKILWGLCMLISVLIMALKMCSEHFGRLITHVVQCLMCFCVGRCHRLFSACSWLVSTYCQLFSHQNREEEKNIDFFDDFPDKIIVICVQILWDKAMFYNWLQWQKYRVKVEKYSKRKSVK